MKYNIIKVCHGNIAQEEAGLTLFQLCNTCSISPDIVIEMMNEGILDPVGPKSSSWRFSHDEVETVKKVMRFRRDLDLNLAGAALALQLLRKIERMEALLERGR